MKNRKKVLSIGSSAFVAAIAAIVAVQFATANPPSQAPEVEVPDEPNPDAWQIATQEEDAREAATIQLVLSDPRIDALTRDAFNYDTDFRSTKNGDEVIVRIFKSENIEGDYQTGYTLTYTGVSEVRMIVKDGSIVSYEETPQQDYVNKIPAYSEDEQRLIELALADSRVESKLAEKEGVDKAIGIGTGVTMEQFGCPDMQCTFVFIYTEEGSMRVIVNTKEMNVVQVEEWS
ncbi:MAG: hypothetical protein MN733_16610 [Nitrososphaera sp.]|nr:hypothetical protein [Nitrososphaera sp.]